MILPLLESGDLILGQITPGEAIFAASRLIGDGPDTVSHENALPGAPQHVLRRNAPHNQQKIDPQWTKGKSRSGCVEAAF